MHGARGAIASGLDHIAAQVEALESAVNENPALAFDLARTVIESTCRTILTERGIAFAATDELPKLFKATSNSLPFLPASENGNIDARKSLAQTLSGLSTAMQGVCELRNACGFASHGSHGPRPRLESVQALLAAEAADTIVGFFHRVHQQDRSAPSPNNLTLENDAEFDEFIDDQFSVVSIFQEDFLASRVLFELAPEPYRLHLSEYKQDKKASEDEEQKEQSPDEVLAATERIMALNEVEP
jgi:hypothetical protein